MTLPSSISSQFKVKLGLWSEYLDSLEQIYDTNGISRTSAGEASKNNSSDELRLRISIITSDLFSSIHDNYSSLTDDDLQEYFKISQKESRLIKDKNSSLVLKFQDGDRLVGVGSALVPYLRIFERNSIFGIAKLIMNPIVDLQADQGKSTLNENIKLINLTNKYSFQGRFSLASEGSSFTEESQKYLKQFEKVTSKGAFKELPHLEMKCTLYKALIMSILSEGKSIHVVMDDFLVKRASIEEAQLKSREDYFYTWENLKFLKHLCSKKPELRKKIHFWRRDIEVQAFWKENTSVVKEKITQSSTEATQTDLEKLKIDLENSLLDK